MNTEKIKAYLDGRQSLIKTLGMNLVSTEAENSCTATMKVTPEVSQPYGFLNGGTSLALAENLAGVGSVSLCPDKIPMGSSVSANHLQAVPVGDTVTIVATILHKGRTTHVWNVNVLTPSGQVASTARVTNYLVDPQPAR